MPPRAKLGPYSRRGTFVDITIRHAEPDGAEPIHRVLSGPRAVRGTLQLPLLDVTLDTLEPLGELPDRASVHLDRGYDS